MGEQRVHLASNNKEVQKFVKNLLRDVQALEKMINEGWFDDEVTRIGAEQELCLVDEHWKPAPLNMELLELLDHELMTTELAKFNLEFNLEPLVFEGKCLSKLENRIQELYQLIIDASAKLNVKPIMTGILPTIRKFDVEINNLTPLERYHALITAINKLRGNFLELNIKGIDELQIKHDSPLLEGCNTGFQVHLQVRPQDFVAMYNISQLITAPILALSANSPLLFGKRLWYETRIALFQQAIDTRTSSEHLREMSPRVTFGSDWLKRSILEIYKEDIARFRVLLSTNMEEDVFSLMEQGITPKLRALQVHNSTVYRWNRPCYGVNPDGKPHLRIENRVMPAGPTIVDEMASSALWFGLMKGYFDHIGDVANHLEFIDARHNFMAAARTGINSTFLWLDEKRYSASELVLKELLPVARQGLLDHGIDKDDVSYYLGIIEERAKAQKTGAQWLLNSYNTLSKISNREEALSTITAKTIANQQAGIPVHKWALADFDDVVSWQPDSILVEEFMTTDVFTVQKDDILELVAEMMDWNKIRYLPVENKKGELEGLLTSRLLLRFFSKDHIIGRKSKPHLVKSVMISEPVTVSPEASIMEAMRIMRDNNFGCLPVVKQKKLVGIITEQDFLKITERLMKRFAALKSTI